MSMIQVAKAAGVSQATVSYVINGKGGVSPGTAKRVEMAMKKLNYVPKPLADRRGPKKVDLNGLKYGCMGVIFYGKHANMVNYPFYARLVHAVEDELSARNLSMMMLRLESSEQIADSYHKMDGAIVCGPEENFPRIAGLPLVRVFGHPDVFDEPVCDHIEPDNERIGVMAAGYLTSRGHKRVGFLNPILPTMRHLSVEARQRSFIDYCSRSCNIECEVYDVPFLERTPQGRLYEYHEIPVLEEFLVEFCANRDRPTGLFIPIDANLVIIQKSLRDKGVIPGKDIELIGCNNEIPLLEGLDPRPATIDINAEQIAKCVVERLLYRVGEKEQSHDVIQISVQPKLIKAGYGVKERW